MFWDCKCKREFYFCKNLFGHTHKKVQIISIFKGLDVSHRLRLAIFKGSLHLILFNDVPESLLITVTYRDKNIAYLYFSLMYNIYRTQGNYIRVMDSDKLIAGQLLLQVFESLERSDLLLTGMDSYIIFKSFHVKNVIQQYFN